MGSSEILESQTRPSKVLSGSVGQDPLAHSSVPAPQITVAFGWKAFAGKI